MARIARYPEDLSIDVCHELSKVYNHNDRARNHNIYYLQLIPTTLMHAAVL